MKLTVLKNIQETPICHTIRFHPDAKFPFLAGQWVLFSAFIDGKKVKRAYSIASPPGKEYIDVTVKLSPNPTFSKLLCEMKEGQWLEAEGPFGKFTYTRGDGDDVVLIGAGSGIAPLMSIARHILDENMDVKITVLFSSKIKEYIIYKDEFDEINNLPNVEVHHTLTQDEWDGLTGRINENKIKLVSRDFSKQVFYICGPPQMVNSVQQTLLKLGVTGDRIRTERYN